MSKFVGYLDTRLIDEFADIHELLAPFAFESAILGRVVEVPAGFKTDFASVPRMVGAYLLVGGKGKRAAVIHDWLYSTRACIREEADKVFREALRCSGYSGITIGLMYAGVRFGGGSHWKGPNVPQEPEVQHAMNVAAIEAP